MKKYWILILVCFLIGCQHSDVDQSVTGLDEYNGGNASDEIEQENEEEQGNLESDEQLYNAVDNSSYLLMNTKALEIINERQYPYEGIQYTLESVEMYDTLNLDKEKDEYIFMTDCRDRNILFAYEEDYERIGEGRASNTVKIGAYDLDTKEMKMMKEFDAVYFVHDMEWIDDNRFIYTGFDEEDRWSVILWDDGKESLLDEGESISYRVEPYVESMNGQFYYQYETVNTTDAGEKYQYGIREILVDEMKVVPKTTYLSLLSEDGNPLDGLYSSEFIQSKKYLGTMMHMGGDTYLEVYEPEEDKSIRMPIYNPVRDSVLLNDGVFQNLQNIDESRYSYMEYTSFDEGYRIIRPYETAYYRMVSNQIDTVLCVDSNFNVFLFTVKNGVIDKQEVHVEDENGKELTGQTVELLMIDENEFLLDFYGDEKENDRMFLLKLSEE